MAETKRSSNAERVATPRTGAQQQQQQQQQPPQSGSGADALKGLSNAIGARIKITTAGSPSQTLEGTLFTACPIFNVIAINTTSGPAPANATSNQPGDYHIVPIAKVQNVQVLSLADSGKDGSYPPIGKVDTSKLKEREEQRIKKIKEEESKRGKGVTAEAQALFNALDRMFKTRWHDTDIIVDEAVIIAAPYTPDSCKAPKGKEQSLAHIRRVVEGEKRKIASRVSSPLPRKGG